MSGEMKDESSPKPRYATTKSGVSVRIVPPIELNTESRANVLRIMKWEDDSAEQVMGPRAER
jgi:hypothetical protein